MSPFLGDERTDEQPQVKETKTELGEVGKSSKKQNQDRSWMKRWMPRRSSKFKPMVPREGGLLGEVIEWWCWDMGGFCGIFLSS